MDYSDQIETFLTIVDELDLPRLYTLIEAGKLDDYYQALMYGEQWLNHVISIHPHPAHFQAVREKLIHKRDSICLFYLKYFSTHRILGEAYAAEHPCMIFILACKDLEVMCDRVKGALNRIEKNPNAGIVICGGGFDPEKTEAEFMFNVLQDFGVKRSNIIVEDDSIDTVANAVFAKLKLRLEEKLPSKGNILVVTSAFHATRSLNIFRRVFSDSYKIAALPVQTTTDSARLSSLAAHELRTEERSTREIFGLVHPLGGIVEDISPGDEITLFFQLVLHHDFYKHRYDLIRKYRTVLLPRQQIESKLKVTPTARWRFDFVPMGTDLKGRVAANSVALDVGSGDPHEGIFDHHHRPDLFPCAAKMVFTENQRLKDRLQGTEQRCLILHREPDLDCLVSAAISWALLEQDGEKILPQLTELADLCARADQGLELPGSELTPYTFTLMLATWLNGEEGRQYLVKNVSELQFLCSAGGMDFRLNADRQLKTATLGVLSIIQWCQIRQETAVLRRMEPSSFDPPLQALIEGVAGQLAEQIGLCEQEMLRVRDNGWIGSMKVLQNHQGTRSACYVRIIDPKANPGILAKYFWANLFRDMDKPVVSIIQSSVGNRTVVSVSPDSNCTLKGLGYCLEQHERSRWAENGIVDQGAPRFRSIDSNGTEHIDPLFDSSDPWYDGRGHGYTIVDTPGSGTVLTLEDVFEVIISTNWQSYASLYENKEYRSWLFMQNV